MNGGGGNPWAQSNEGSINVAALLGPGCNDRGMGMGCGGGGGGFGGPGGYGSGGKAGTGGRNAVTSPNAPQTYYPPNRGFMKEPNVVTLQPGTRIDRYGSSTGTFTAPQGTPFPQRSLPSEAASRPLNSYEVVKPIPGVNSGPAAPWFNQPGGGTQFELPSTVQQLINSGHLKPLK